MRRLAHWMWLGVLVVGCGGEDRPEVSAVEPGRVPEAGRSGRSGDDDAAGAAGDGAARAGSAGASGSGTVKGGEGGTSIGSEGGSAGAGESAGTAGVAPDLAPIVGITAPADLLHPDDGEVLSDSVSVLCLAAPPDGGAPIDVTKVSVDLFDESGEQLASETADRTDEEGVFRADFVVANYPVGAVTFECTASTQGSDPLTTTAVVHQFIDHGPVITALVPVEDEALPARETRMRFQVDPTPLAEDDAGAEVGEVSLQVAGVDFELTPTDVPNVYETLVPFEDTAVYDPMPVGTVPVTVTAVNSRTPEGISESLAYNFVLDGSGPRVTIRSPTPLAVVGGQVTLTFDLNDDFSGVDDDTLRVMVNVTDPADGARYSPDSAAWSRDGSTYRFSFDSAAVQGSKVQMTVNITVDDLAGNTSETASALYYIDNEPPYVSLDPPPVRDLTKVNANIFCTHPFDPVGAGAVSDEEVRPFIAHYRTFVLDRTNSTPGQTIFYYSTVNVDRTQLFLATDTTVPLVVDSNGDGECDAISGDGLDLPQQELMPITPKGDEFKDSPATLLPDESPVIDAIIPPDDLSGICQADDRGATESMCNGTSDMWRATAQRIGGVSLPAVFAVGVTNDSGAACAGSQWDLDPYVDDEGWVCLAAVAYDRVGNRGVSEPLRVCLDDVTDGVEPGCATGEVPPPDCTDGCARQPDITDAERLLVQF